MVYECDQRKRKVCKARVKLQDDVIAVVIEHEHPPNIGKIEALKIRSGISLKYNRYTQQVLGEALTGEEAAAQLPSTSTLDRSVVRKWR